MNKTSILIPTCSIYINVWEPHLKLLKKYWNDCLFKIFLGTDKNFDSNKLGLEKNYDIEYIFTDLPSKGDNILNRIQFYLKKIKEKKFEIVLLLIDDFFLVRNVNNKDIFECIQLMTKDSNIGALRLHPSPPGKKGSFYKNIKFEGQFPHIKIGEEYRDPICSHCLDKLYKPPPNIFLPHLYADLDDKNIKNIHIKKNSIKLFKVNNTVVQPTFWNINFLMNIINNLLYPNNNIRNLILNKKLDVKRKDLILFEVIGGKIKSNKYILCPEKRNDIIYPTRGFCGGGIFRGIASKWVIQLMKKEKIEFIVDNKNCVFNRKKYNSDFDNYLKGKSAKYADKII